ncbi:site-2 protease family protein [Vibrio zhugei]|uniref:Site-2 protease family protein n=1 Tax=Vibrio zhugei TaxID=2479546 RepID=A0ABV7C4L8_9VIBR|nr:site-2 protease family protein [Vibrio zhugei]
MRILIGLVLGFVLVMPLIVLLHELGHATPQLLTGHAVEIRLGSGSNAKEFQVGKLKLLITPLSMNVGFVSIERDVSKNLQVVSLLMGPVVSLILCIGLYLLRRYELPYLAQYLVDFGLYFLLFQFLFTSIPIYYPSYFGAYEGMPSDGRQVLELFGVMKGQGA